MTEGFRRTWLNAASRLRRQLRSVTAPSRGWHGRLVMETGLALDAGTALVPGLFLVMAAGIGGFTAHARRRVTGSVA